VLTVLFAVASVLATAPAKGPLRVCKENAGHFTDDTGNAAYLTGSHTWANLQDIGLGLKAASMASSSGLHRRHLADYDAELRGADGRVDVEGMVKRLKELGVTTYYWLVWHARTDWDDLKLFLPKAAQANIAVWVYLVPPTESAPKYGDLYCEPFRLDYGRWAE
jgi:hypothetical protein